MVRICKTLRKYLFYLVNGTKYGFVFNYEKFEDSEFSNAIEEKGLNFEMLKYKFRLLTLRKDWFVFLHCDLKLFSKMITKKPKSVLEQTSTPQNTNQVILFDKTQNNQN